MENLAWPHEEPLAGFPWDTWEQIHPVLFKLLKPQILFCILRPVSCLGHNYSENRTVF